MNKILIDRQVVEQALEAFKKIRCDALYEQDCNVCNSEEALRAALAEPDDEPTYCPTCGEEDGGTTCGMPDCGLRCGAEPVQESQGCDHCEHPLYAGTRETLRLVDELALCAELKREYQEQFAQAAVQRDALLAALKELTGHANKRFTGGVWDRARAAIKAVEEGIGGKE